MIFHHRQRDVTDICLNLEIDGIPLERVFEFEFLGLTVNEHLTWHSHINKIANKISRSLGVMNKLKHFLSHDIMRTLYNSMILPHLQYSVLCWGTLLTRIRVLQKKAIRIISLSKYNAHTETIFKRLNLLKVDDIFTYFLL